MKEIKIVLSGEKEEQIAQHIMKSVYEAINEHGYCDINLCADTIPEPRKDIQIPTSQPSIKRVWGIAKSPELKLTDEELHLLVQAHTGKDSIKALNKRELQTVIRVLGNMKDSAKKSERGRNRYSGSEVTENQRKKIYKLTQELGWDKPARVNGMCQKMFGVSAVEWLNYQQCSKLIEALKSMLKRQKEKEEQDEGLQANSDSQG